MKVVYVLSVFPKISETFILNEIVQAQKQGIEIQVVAFGNANEDRVHPDVSRVGPVSYFSPPNPASAVGDHFYWLFKCPGRYIKAMCLASRRSSGLSKLFLFSLNNIRLIEQLRPDVLHAHFGTWTADMAMLAGVLLGVPYTFTTHSYDIFSFPPKNLVVKSRLAKKHITISAYNKNYLVNHFGVRPQDIAIVHCGVDLTKVPQGQSYVASNKIVTMARLEPSKGLSHLIRVYGLIRDKGFEFEAIIIGEGSERPVLEKLITELGLQNRVRLLGNRTQNNIFEILLTCKLMVMTSTVEGIPVSLMEAMAFKIPVIASRITGIPELIDDGQSGFLVEPTETEGLADKIVRLLTDDALRTKFMNNGFEKVRKEFNLEAEVSKLIEIWKA